MTADNCWLVLDAGPSSLRSRRENEDLSRSQKVRVRSDSFTVVRVEQGPLPGDLGVGCERAKGSGGDTPQRIPRPDRYLPGIGKVRRPHVARGQGAGLHERTGRLPPRI